LHAWQITYISDSLNQKLLESKIPVLAEETISARRAVKSGGIKTKELVPGRMTTDRLVNIFLQEFAPLFPILHSPTILALYEEYVGNAGRMKDAKGSAQLNLVFAISGLSSQARTSNKTTTVSNHS
jgi:hypothetical protein